MRSLIVYRLFAPFFFFCFAACSSVWASTKSWNFLDSSDYIYDSENVVIKDMRVSVKQSKQINVDSSLNESGSLEGLSAVNSKVIVFDSTIASDFELVSSVVESHSLDTEWYAFNIIGDIKNIDLLVKADNDRNRVQLLPFVKFTDSVTGQYMQFKIQIKKEKQNLPARIDSINIINSLQSHEYDLSQLSSEYLKDTQHLSLKRQEHTYVEEGKYESDIFDAEHKSTWESLTLKSNLFFNELGSNKDGYTLVFYSDVFSEGKEVHCIVTTDIDNNQFVYINGIKQEISSVEVPQDVEITEYGYFVEAAQADILYKQTFASLVAQVRSCDNDSCSGYEFVGPDGTSKTFFDATSLIDLSTLEGQKQYFQYKVFFKTEDPQFSPHLYSAELSYNSFPTEAMTIMPKNINEYNCPVYLDVSSFNDSSSAGFVTYQITNEALSANPLWYYWTGSSWQLAAGSKQSNKASVINANLATFDKPGIFSFKAFLNPLGANFALNAVALEYEPNLSDAEIKLDIQLEHKLEEIFHEDQKQEQKDLFNNDLISSILQAVDANTQALPFLNDIKCDLLILVKDLKDPVKKSKVTNFRKANEYWGAKEIEKFILFRTALSKEQYELYQKMVAENKLFVDLDILGLTDSVVDDLNKDQVIFLNKLFRKKLLKQTIIKDK